MDVRRTSSLLWSASVLAIIAGCSYAPTQTETAPAKPAYSAPKPVTVAPPATVAIKDSPTPTATPKPVKQPVTTKPAPKPATVPTPQTTSKPAQAKPQPAPVNISTPTPAVAVVTPKTEPPKPPATLSTAKPDSTAVPKAPVVETIAVSLNKMPISIHNQWTLDRTEAQCLLKSTTANMDDGQGGTKVTFVLAPGSLLINTESDIDLSYKGTGISIDGTTHFDLETVDRRTNLTFSKQRQALLASMQTGNKLTLTLGFWPTWPVTHPYSMTLPLEHFATAMKAWETCNQLLSRN